MHTYVLMKSGEIFILYGTHTSEQELYVYPLALDGKFNPTVHAVSTFKESDVRVTDTNLSVLKSIQHQ